MAPSAGYVYDVNVNQLGWVCLHLVKFKGKSAGSQTA